MHLNCSRFPFHSGITLHSNSRGHISFKLKPHSGRQPVVSILRRVARLLVWVIKKMPWALLCSYLDDFWLTQKTLPNLNNLASEFIRIIETEIGFPISHNKTLGPATKLNFVGLTADLEQLCITLPDDKRLKAINLINTVLQAHNNNTFVSVKDLERVTGMLNYACQAIPIGHPWLQSTYSLQWVRGDNKTDRTVSDLVADDLKMFRRFLTTHSLFLKSVPFLDRLGVHKQAIQILANASGNPTLGFGCYLPLTEQWCGTSWTETNWFQPQSEGGLGLHAHKIIYLLELFAITLAFKQFAPHLTARVVILRSDNQGWSIQ